ncbi:MAG: transposase, partial [Bryobacterales bacterium]|nr:transposase [Bryobacterales bacterium]
LERRFANTPDGRRTLCDWLRELGARRVAVEPTGRYHRALHQCLCDDGVKVVLANPQRMRNFARSLGEQAKSDRIDAAMLARYARLDGIEGVAPKPEAERALADLLALRDKSGTRRRFFDKLGVLSEMFWFPSWTALFETMLGKRPPPPHPGAAACLS